MNLIFRFLKTILLYLVHPYKRGLFEESKISFRVWPNDLDTNFHMNNGRYLTLLDLGRLDLLLHLQAVPKLMKNHLGPVLASVQVRFRRPLKLGQKFEVVTRFVTWDTKWIYLEQKIFRKGDLVLHAYLKGVFVGPKGSVPITQVLELMGFKESPKPFPAAFSEWLRAEEAMVKQ